MSKLSPQKDLEAHTTLRSVNLLSQEIEFIYYEFTLITRFSNNYALNSNNLFLTIIFSIRRVNHKNKIVILLWGRRKP